jgi:hypothetical protein
MHFGLRINKTERPDKTPYTLYYPHTIDKSHRTWNQGYYQVASIDPARQNYALRIERRHDNGFIQPVVFDKVKIESIREEDGATVYDTYEELTKFLRKYDVHFMNCHYIIIERQLPQNYKATRIEQHSISYFSILVHNNELLTCIVEVDPKLKGKMLGAEKGINDRQLKSWAVMKARELLTMRGDNWSLGILNHFVKKQDDLSDTVCQIEALFKCWELPLTIDLTEKPELKPETETSIVPVTSVVITEKKPRKAAVKREGTVQRKPRVKKVVPTETVETEKVDTEKVTPTRGRGRGTGRGKSASSTRGRGRGRAIQTE